MSINNSTKYITKVIFRHLNAEILQMISLCWPAVDCSAATAVSVVSHCFLIAAVRPNLILSWPGMNWPGCSALWGILGACLALINAPTAVPY